MFTTKVVPAITLYPPTVRGKDKQKIQKTDIPLSFFSRPFRKAQKAGYKQNIIYSIVAGRFLLLPVFYIA